MKALRIGTRGSALALWQGSCVRERLKELHGAEAELVRIHTSGDKFASEAIAQIGAEGGAKGIFIKEIEDALLAGTIDVAVHSMKDVPTEIPRGLVFAAIARREDPRDCLIARGGESLAKLRGGARVGTSSLRRQAQLRRFRRDFEVTDLRGNVDTRLKKVAAGEFDAIVLAIAGVKRLGASERVTEVLEPDVMLPAVGQGALGIEVREEDEASGKLAASLDDAETRACIEAERALLRTLEGGCQVPLGAWARLEGDEMRIEACVLSPDGSECLRRELRGPATEAEKIGERLGRVMIEAGADRILRLAGRAIGTGD